MIQYQTNLSKYLNYYLRYFTKSFVGPWRIRSASLISILLGFYLVSNISPFILRLINYRIIAVLPILILTEIFVRFRSNPFIYKKHIFISIIDNLRIGSTYALVLEAYKLGS